MVDHREREALLWSELRRHAAERGLDVTDPIAKMREVLFLVEWPTVVAGELRRGAPAAAAPTCSSPPCSRTSATSPSSTREGTLSSTFLYVRNGDPAWGTQITAGNERVLEGTDRGRRILVRQGQGHRAWKRWRLSLDKIVFHDKAGTMKDKTDRLVALCRPTGRGRRRGTPRDASGLSRPPDWPRPTRSRSWCASSPIWKG